MAELSVQDVTARSVRVRFVSGGTGAPLVLLHDYLAGRSEWDDVQGALAARFRLVVPDFPGFGESEKPEVDRFPYDLDALTESIVDVIAGSRLGRVHLGGHGLGALVAMNLATRHGALVDRLLLVAPPLFGARPLQIARIAAAPVVGPLLFKQLYGPGLFRRHFRDHVYGKAMAFPEARVEGFFERFNAPAAREAAYATLSAMLDTRAVEASLGRIASPTLILWGRDDRCAPVEGGRRLQRAIPRAKLELLDCAHSPAEERPADFARIATTFLAARGEKAA